jgi:hypothetical protein
VADESDPAADGVGREDGAPGPAASPSLEFEAYVAPPAFAHETVVAPPPLQAAAAAQPGAAEPTPAERTAARRRIGTSVFTSVAIHFTFFVLLFLVWPGGGEEPAEEPAFAVTFRARNWVGDDPEAEGTGPRGDGPNEPPPEPPKGEDVAPGFLDDHTVRGANVGVGGGAAGSAFAGRLDGKEGLVAAGGGDGGTEGAVRMALEWLARHQAKDGTWNAHAFDDRCPAARCEGRAEEEYVVATTALALLPFLGAGHTWRDGPWKDTVRRGLRALRDRQHDDGTFDDGGKRAYSDALATLALCEAYGVSRDEALGELAQRSVGFWVDTQNEAGAWRYDRVSKDGDSSVTGWVVAALASARRGGLAVPDRTLARARSWFRDHTDADGLVGYTVPGSGSKSLLGVGYFSQVLLGASPGDASLAPTAARLERALPRWPDAPDDAAGVFGVADPIHWYYGGLAAFQHGGTTWKSWNERLKQVLLARQERRGCAAGSWPAVGSTGAKGGRVVATALCALALEVYYRYPRATAAR